MCVLDRVSFIQVTCYDKKCMCKKNYFCPRVNPRVSEAHCGYLFSRLCNHEMCVFTFFLSEKKKKDAKRRKLIWKWPKSILSSFCRCNAPENWFTLLLCNLKIGPAHSIWLPDISDNQTVTVLLAFNAAVLWFSWCFSIPSKVSDLKLQKVHR